MISVSFQGNNERRMSENLVLKENESSFGINNSIFNMKINQRKSHLSDESGHEVIFNVTFAIAIPGVFMSTKVHESKRVSVSDHSSRNNHQFFHLEFDLFSNNIISEPFKTDIGFFGMYAKIYPDKSESKVIPVWTDGEDTWISWIQQFEFWITDQHVRDLCTHKMRVMIWDTKDKCAPKVRFDRPKPPRSASKSKSTDENLSWIKQTVLMISKDYATTTVSPEDIDRILPHQIVTSQISKQNPEKSSQILKSAKTKSIEKSSISSPELNLTNIDQLMLFVGPKNDTNSKLESYSQLEKLLEHTHTTSDSKHKPTHSNYSSKLKSSLSNVKDSSNTPLLHPSDNHITLEPRKSVTLQIDNDDYHKNGRTNVEINMPDLFLKNQTISRMRNSVNSLEDMFCRVSIESDILSLDQKKRLNPFIIKILKINNLAVTEKNINEINKKYKPLYCEYQFSNFKRYKTLERLHRKSITLDDISVVLFGELSEIKIKEQLLNAFFTIQIFNRIKQESLETEDMKHDNLADLKNNKNIGDINFTSTYKTAITPAVSQPQGEARIDLSDLINKNLKFLEVTVPIVPVSTLSLQEDNEERNKQFTEDQTDFIESETTIKVSFQLAESLSVKPDVCSKGNHLNRFIIVNHNVKCDFLRNICTKFVLKHNCGQLHFKGTEPDAMKQFLYSIKNTSNNEDLLMGFFLVDRKCEILFIEGRQKQMKVFHEYCSEMLNTYRQIPDYSVNIKLLYNDSLSFNEKDNFSILTMIPLILSKDISFFASQPLLYVRDILPKNCVTGICRLNDLLVADSMQVVSRNNLVPSFQMIEDLSQYLCSHIDYPTENTMSNILDKDPKIKLLNRKVQRNQIKTAPIIRNRKSSKNKGNVGAKMQRSLTYVYADKECEFSYSSQSKNSISSALKEVRNQMDLKRRYTFSQDYLFSGSVDPVDLEDIYSTEEQKLRSEPRWVIRGPRTAIEDNAESNNLSIRRIEDLREPWKENELNRSVMKPPIPERDQTYYNFDTYIRPLHLLDRSPTSMLPPYSMLRQIEKEEKQINYTLWKSKLCVSNPDFKVHRLLTQTELIEKGRKSSNQLSKLQGLRKNESEFVNWIVSKYGDPNSIPAIHVLPKEETSSPSYTVGPDPNAHLVVNYIPINNKDKNFKTIYHPSKDNKISTNPKSRITVQNQSPFSITC